MNDMQNTPDRLDNKLERLHRAYLNDRKMFLGIVGDFSPGRSLKRVAISGAVFSSFIDYLL
jgi:hypothetical protein